MAHVLSRSAWAAAVLVASTACSSEGSSAAQAPDGGAAEAESPDGPEILATDSGRLRGVEREGAIVWKGIPYAAPPVGPYRWREPQPAAPWNGVRDALAFGPKCMQTAPDTSTSTGGSEDCLTLNVWRPAVPAPPGGFPVMVFIHGGYNVRGSSSEELEPGIPTYEGHALVPRDVILVTMNYRVGALGWMGHPALTAESPHKASGNYGALDQVAALKWVHTNAAALGADRSKVLLFGQSAGATNTCGLLASPLAAGLFSRAVMHSGSCGTMAPGRADEAGIEVAKKLGCDSSLDVLACLREKSAADLASATTLDFRSGGFSWGHTVDNYFLPDAIGEQITSGRHNHVPLVIGVTAHEMTTLWRSAFPTLKIPTTEAEHHDAIRTVFGPARADRIIAQYPSASYPTPSLASVAAMTDANFVCPMRTLARVMSVTQAEPVRRFYFSHVLETGTARQFGAGHGFDMFFVFSPRGLSFFDPSPAEQALATSMVGYLTRFAATGDPNGEGAVPWPSYVAAQD